MFTYILTAQDISLLRGLLRTALAHDKSLANKNRLAILDSTLATAEQAVIGDDAGRVLLSLVDTINTTGGLTRGRKGNLVPVADEDWLDLAYVYRDACRLLGREPRLDALSDDEENL